MERLKKWLSGSGAMRYALVAVLLGMALLLLPGTEKTAETADSTEEARMEALLGQIEGVGSVHMLLSESGAAVVCSGADSPEVRLEICRAIGCYTGLGSDRISIFLMQSN